MVDERLKDAFWASVIDSLVEFHGMDWPQAKCRVSEYQAKIRCAPVEASFPDLIYHSEPFQLANRLAEGELDIADHRDAYLDILERRFGVVGVAATASDGPSVQARR